MRRVFDSRRGITPVIGGRRTPKNQPRHMLEKYVDLSQLPAPPDEIDYVAKAAAAVATMLGNDSRGCCVEAGYLHSKAIWLANAPTDDTTPPADLYVPTEAETVALYSGETGYVDGDPSTDNGTDEEQFLADMAEKGDAEGTKLQGHVGIVASNFDMVKLVSWLFESPMLGMCLPDPWTAPFPNGDGFTWDVAGDPDPNDGHCVVGGGHRADALKVVTWGLWGWLTAAALAKYATAGNGGMLYAVLSPDIISRGQTKAPSGVGWDDLLIDLRLVGESPMAKKASVQMPSEPPTIPPPKPPPPQEPAEVPDPVVTEEPAGKTE